MRIVFVNNFYNAGGSTKTAYALAENFSKNHEMQFYGFWDGIYREKFSELGETFLLKSNNFDYDDLMIENIKVFNPDIIHIFIPGNQNPSYFKKLPEKAKKFVTVLCNQKLGFESSNFTKVFFLSKYGESFTGPVENGMVLRPGFDYSFEHKPQRQNPVIARVSAFCPSKLVDHTVFAAKKFPKNNFIIAGEVQDLEYYKHIISLKETEKIHNLRIFSNASDDLVAKILEDCDIWHYPTSSEVFCFSVLEAMAAKKPVISYKLDAVKEFFDYNDWLADDVDDMISKTAAMINRSPSEREEIGEKNYDLYLEYGSRIFSEKVMRQYLETESEEDLAL